MSGDERANEPPEERAIDASVEMTFPASDPPAHTPTDAPADRHAAPAEATARCEVVLIGGSAGAVEPLLSVLRGLPADFPASVLAVLHGFGDRLPVPLRLLERASALGVEAVDRPTPMRRGRVYIASPDRHLLVRRGEVYAGSGPKENGFRPSVDALFRTAAAHYGARVAAVVLSGLLDDGSLGLLMVKRRGGVAIVQDPAEALFPSMPSSALEQVAVDHVAASGELPRLLASLVTEQRRVDRATLGASATSGADRAAAGSRGFSEPAMSGPASGQTCPECGGAMWRSEEGGAEVYECHTGHSFTAAALAATQDPAIDEAMWTALRALQEAAELRRRMAENAQKRGWHDRAATYTEDARGYDRRADAVRALVLGEPSQARRS